MNFEHSARAQDFIARMEAFVEAHIEPIESELYSELEELNPTGDWRSWKVHPTIEKLKRQAQAEALGGQFGDLEAKGHAALPGFGWR